VPAETVVVPEYWFGFESVVVPVPRWMRLPVPVILFVTVIEPLWLKARVPLLVMVPEPRLPVVSPLPT